MKICRGFSGLVWKMDKKGLSGFEYREITMRVSADDIGMSLSLSDETGPDPTMLIVSLGSVADELRRVLEMEGK